MATSQPYTVACAGGLVKASNQIDLLKTPGVATDLRNFEVSIEGGYRRINDYSKIGKFLKDNKLPYFYWSYKDLDEIGYDTIDKALDMKHMNLRIQIYIKCKAKVNISNQCGANHLAARYSDCYEVQRQFPIAHNFIEGETYL